MAGVLDGVGQMSHLGVRVHMGDDGYDVMRIPDYVAIGILIVLAVWAAADLIPHDKFKL